MQSPKIITLVGTDYLIHSQRDFASKSGNQTHFKGVNRDTKEKVFIVANYYKENKDVYVYTQPDFFKPNSRSKISENIELAWLLDGENYPLEIFDGTNTFKNIPDEIYTSDEGLPTAIVRYETQADIEDYSLLIVEEGIGGDEGGWLEFYEGKRVEFDWLTDL